jgi:carbon monoxide dehydrogenase subunit G
VAEASYSTTTRVPVDALWAFVEDMDHWARFVAGYQSHEKKSESESLWTLKGDLGVMSRTLTFRVLITEWNGPSRVRFQLSGLNEPMSGEGAFTIERAGDAAPSAAVAAPALRRGFLFRVLEAFFRRFFGRLGGRVEREAPASGSELTRMSFTLRLDPGGPMAPMVNAMIKPLMLPAAEDLATRILAHLEDREGATR